MHGRLGEAVEHAREAIVWDRDRPTRADDLVTLSEALAALGESEEAASALAEAESLWPDNPRLAHRPGRPRRDGRPHPLTLGK